DEGPYNNKSLIVVPSKTPGISFSSPIDKLGQRSSDTAQVFFDDVRVPQANVIGGEGMGFMMQMLQFQEERIFCAASALGGMSKCVELTIDYARQRMIYGKPLLDQQVVHYRLAELMTEIEALRGLVHSVCEQHIAGDNVTMTASMAKLTAGRLMREVTDSCLQYWGGQGFTWDNPIARAYRD
ncbi:acyl-CoA dehydrogenase, partial [Acinetobacter baumannii]